jgi:glycosyltransferase involved in cell wall biosynthesis
MSGSPLVSVIIPVFNRHDVLSRAIASVRAQTFEDYELIIVDDGSSKPIMQKTVQAGIQIIRHDTNRGAAASRNTGVDASKGHYLAFLDSDDEWHAEKLARQVAFMQSASGRRASCTGFALVDEGGIFDRRLPPDLSDLKVILWGCRISPGSTLMVERTLYEAAGPMDETLRRLEDWDWMIFAAKYAPIHGLREILVDVQHDRYAHVNETKFVAAARKMADYTRAGRYGLSRSQERILQSAIQYELSATYYRKRRFGPALRALAASFAYSPWKRPEHMLSALKTVRADIKRAVAGEG